MGSNYDLYKDKNFGVSITESSNELRLMIYGLKSDSIECTDEMEPSKMLKLLMEGIKATSYWMDEKEFNEVFSKLEVYPY